MPMPKKKTTKLNKEHCVFPKAEQIVCCRIPMEEASCWTWVREKRNEDVNWKPILKGDDVVDDSEMVDSVVAFVVEQPFFPRGACDNYFHKKLKSDKRQKGNDTYASKVFIVNGFKSAKPSNPPKVLFGPNPLMAEVSRIAFKEGLIFS